MDNNLYRILYEVENGLQWQSTSSYPMTFEEFTQSTDSAYDLAMAFISNYERPLDPDQPIRGVYAENWFDYLSDLIFIPNSPVHSDIIITRVYGYVSSSYSCGYHTGIDFAPYGDTPANPDLYSVVDGEVVEVHTDPNNALGCYVVIEDTDGNYWRYCHMVYGSIGVSVGDPVDINTYIGQMGATGNVTGIHLHLEYASTSYWNCNTFMNPCDYLHIPNEVDTVIHWGASPIPPEPPETKELLRKKFPWAVLTRKIRNRRA